VSRNLPIDKLVGMDVGRIGHSVPFKYRPDRVPFKFDALLHWIVDEQ
jgi:hypothetical protein